MTPSAFERVAKLVERLRAEDGCPWDRAQNHRSLRPYLIEEAYEAIAAIDANDPAALADELGDILLQVLLHSQIAAEEHEFCIEDVIDLLSKKLLRRHPHVFAVASKDTDAIRHNWELIKQEERQTHYVLPSILAARKLIDRMNNLGISIEDISLASLEEKEGKRILKAIAASWKKGIDPELALEKSIAALSQACPR